MNLYKNSLLKYNPRSFLELSKNEVNRQIEASIRSTAGNNFALFNNGVTIISDSTKVSSDTARRGIGQIFLTNPQLINGGQTAYTLATIFADCLKTNDFNVFKGKQVLARSSVKSYFAPDALASLLKESLVAAYAYGYEVLQLVEEARKAKPATPGDRFNTLLYGQGLRLGQYALVSACTAQGRTAGENPKEALGKVLAQWIKFENWAEKRKRNKGYTVNGAFDYTNCYKGPTVGADLSDFALIC